jgi:hypothetical protein
VQTARRVSRLSRAAALVRRRKAVSRAKPAPVSRAEAAAAATLPRLAQGQQVRPKGAPTAPGAPACRARVLTRPWQVSCVRIESTVGVVQLMGFPNPYVQVMLYNRTDPWLGEAELSTATCRFHHDGTKPCADCKAGEVCSIEAQCVAERRTVKDATRLVISGDGEREYTSDPQLHGVRSTCQRGYLSRRRRHDRSARCRHGPRAPRPRACLHCLGRHAARLRRAPVRRASLRVSD